jgi:hypothetical protein
MAMGGGTSISSSEQDASAQNSGNVGGYTSADRVSKQFNNFQGSAGLDLNSYLGMSTSRFYDAIQGEQGLEAGALKPASNAFKYSALAAAVVVSLVAVFALKGRK